MVDGISNGHVTDDVTAPHVDNSWRCYIATIANYQIVCCEAVRSAILATAGHLVLLITSLHLASASHVSVAVDKSLSCNSLSGPLGLYRLFD